MMVVVGNNDNLDNNKPILLLSGYEALNGGHLITLYLTKNDNDNYKLVLVNSGDGLTYHVKNNNNEYQCIIEKTINKDKLSAIILHCIVMVTYREKGNFNKIITVKNYYRVLMDILYNGNTKAYDQLDNNRLNTNPVHRLQMNIQYWIFIISLSK